MALKFLFSASVLLASVGLASAAPVGFDLAISGNAALSVQESYSLKNTSTSALLNSITINLEGTGFGYDCVTALSGPSGTVSGTGDNDCGGTGNPDNTSFTISYSGFDPLETAMWTADLDPNSAPNDWRVVLANASVSVLFSDGQVLKGDFLPLASDLITDSTQFSFSMSSAAVPLPAALPLLAGAIGGLSLLGWRKKSLASHL